MRKNTYEVVNAALLIVLFVWGSEALVDAFIFRNGTLLETLFCDYDLHELYMRSMYTLIIVIGAVLASHLIQKSRQAVDETYRAHQQLKLQEEALRAANQQLQASFMQLEAGNQQLRASESALRRLNNELQDSQSALRESEARYRGVIESMEDLVVRVDPAGRFKFVNQAYCRKFGKTPEELLGQPFTPLVHEDDLPTTLAAMKDLDVSPYRTRMIQRAMTVDGWRWLSWEYVAIKDAQGRTVEIQGVGRDITDWKLAEEQLRHAHDALEQRVRERTAELVRLNQTLLETGHRQKSILDNIPDMAWLKDEGCQFIAVNEPFAQACGIPKDALTGQTDRDIWPPDIAERYRADDLDVMQSRLRKCIEEPLDDKSGRMTWIETIKSPIFDDTGRVIGTTGIARDITKRKLTEDLLHRSHEQLENLVRERTAELVNINDNLNTEIRERIHAEDALRESEERYRILTDNAPEMIYVVNHDGVVQYVNRLAASMFHAADPHAVVGKNLTELFPPQLAAQHLNRIQEVIDTGVSYESEIEERFLKKTVWIDVRLVPLRNAHGSITAALGLSQDITPRKLADERIHASLREKEVLLKEIHHRVKNNLQVISSLLSLQSHYIRDPVDLELFKESQNRVRTMALIHEKLYQSNDLARINFEEYLRSMTRELVRSYKMADVDLQLEIDQVLLNLDAAIPCGLIVHELLSNALKHAFPPDQQPAAGRVNLIQIMCHGEGGQLRLMVRDNGVGLPPGVEHDTSKTLGLQLVKTLIHQLRGSFVIDRSEGTVISIQFPHEAGASDGPDEHEAS